MPGRIFYPSVFNPPGSFTATSTPAPRGWECVDPDTTRRLRPIQPQGEVLPLGQFGTANTQFGGDVFSPSGTRRLQPQQPQGETMPSFVPPPANRPGWEAVAPQSTTRATRRQPIDPGPAWIKPLVQWFDVVAPAIRGRAARRQPQGLVLPPGLFRQVNTAFGGEVFAPVALPSKPRPQPARECLPPGVYSASNTAFGVEVFAPVGLPKSRTQQPQGECLPPGLFGTTNTTFGGEVFAPVGLPSKSRPQPPGECLPPGVYYASNTRFGGEAFAPATTPKARTQQPQGECLPPGLFRQVNTAFGGEVFAPVGLPKKPTPQPAGECLPPGLFRQVNTAFGGADAVGPLVTRRPRGQQQPAGECLPPGLFGTVIITALKTVGSWMCGGLSRGWLAGGMKRTWYYGGPMASVLVNNTLQKATGDTVRFGLDLGDLPEIVTGGQTILSVAVTSLPAGLTIGTPGIDAGGYSVSAVFSGGTAGVSYDVAWTVTLSNSLISRTGVLNVL